VPSERRILVIEDDESIRGLIRAAFESDFEVDEAGSGDEGLESARARRPDVVLLDMGLPGMHGSRVLQTLKADPVLRAVPVIVVSAWGESVTADLARKHGAHAVLRKPFVVAELVQTVREAQAAG
jgi:two-component system phosphate regulon response regulator PhoB